MPSAQPGSSLARSANGMEVGPPLALDAPISVPSCNVAVNCTVTQSLLAGVAPVPTTTSAYFKPDVVFCMFGSSSGTMGVAMGTAGFAGAAVVGATATVGAAVGAGVAPPPHAARLNATNNKLAHINQRFINLLVF